MATENRGVMVYLPLEVEEKMIEFCTEYKIVRKDKEGNISPSLGSGIVTYLKSHLLGELPSDRFRGAPTKQMNAGLTRAEVLELIAESSISNVLSGRLGEGVDSELVRRIETIEQSLSSSTSLTSDEVEKLIQESERRVMETVHSMWAEMQGELTMVKAIDERVNALQTSISTINKQKKENKKEDIVKSITTKPSPNNVTSGDKPISKDIRRWLQPIQEDEKFRAIIQMGIDEELSNKEIVTRLFDAGYGKNDNTELYPHNLASAMKTAFQLSLTS